MVLLGRRTNPGVMLTAYVSVLLVGGYALMGLSTAIISRYGVPLDVLLIVTMVMGTSIWSGGRGSGHHLAGERGRSAAPVATSPIAFLLAHSSRNPRSKW